MNDFAIHHDPERQRFTLTAGQDEGPVSGGGEGGGNEGAVLDYRLSGPGTVDFTHTWVPPRLRNRGLAESLVRRGLKWARENDYEIKASCSYVARFLGR